MDAVGVKSRVVKVNTNQLEYIKRNVIAVLAKDKLAWPFLKPVDHQKLNLPVRLLLLNIQKGLSENR